MQAKADPVAVLGRDVLGERVDVLEPARAGLREVVVVRQRDLVQPGGTGRDVCERGRVERGDRLPRAAGVHAGVHAACLRLAQRHGTEVAPVQLAPRCVTQRSGREEERRCEARVAAPRQPPWRDVRAFRDERQAERLGVSRQVAAGRAGELPGEMTGRRTAAPDIADPVLQRREQLGALADRIVAGKRTLTSRSIGVAGVNVTPASSPPHRCQGAERAGSSARPRSCPVATTYSACSAPLPTRSALGVPSSWREPPISTITRPGSWTSSTAVCRP